MTCGEYTYLMRPLCLSALVVLLTGCNSMNARKAMRKGLAGLVGQPVSVAIKTLGEPTGRSETAALSSRFDTPIAGPPTALVTWERDGCLISVMTDAKGIVSRAGFTGSQAECAQYLDILEHAPHKSARYCGWKGVDACIDD